MSMNQPPWNQQPNEVPSGYQPSRQGTVRARAQPVAKECRYRRSGTGRHGASFVPACRQLTRTSHTRRGRPRRIDPTARRGPARRGERRRLPPLEQRDPTVILFITATAHTLRAVLHPPAVRRCIQLDYRGAPRARCLIDGRPVATDPPRDATDAVHLLSTLVRTPGVAVTAVALLVKLEGGMAFTSALAALDAARIAWPDVPHLACLGPQPHVEAMIDDQFRAQLGGSDDRAERILDYPPGHFARARERARAKLNE
jgi:hypothetical protein